MSKSSRKTHKSAGKRKLSLTQFVNVTTKKREMVKNVNDIRVAKSKNGITMFKVNKGNRRLTKFVNKDDVNKLRDLQGGKKSHKTPKSRKPKRKTHKRKTRTSRG